MSEFGTLNLDLDEVNHEEQLLGTFTPGFRVYWIQAWREDGKAHWRRVPVLAFAAMRAKPGYIEYRPITAHTNCVSHDRDPEFGKIDRFVVADWPAEQDDEMFGRYAEQMTANKSLSDMTDEEFLLSVVDDDYMLPSGERRGCSDKEAK